ncbi:AMP-binding protein [Lactiplantibacillus plantarum]|uniref:non-ribosomal peptide synthetase n=1 Tax=Lactiplantibacillus plantarum TaxID=1590 RepID=UPI0039A37458
MFNTTCMQSSILLHQKEFPEDASYNLPYLWKLSGHLDVPKLSKVLEKVFNIHDVYHMFIKDGKNNLDWSKHFIPQVKTIDQNREIFEKSVVKDTYRLANQPLDVFKWPLEEAIIYQSKYIKDEFFLFLNISHEICDVYSAYQLFTEINDGYNRHLYFQNSSQFESSKAINKTINKSREERAIGYFKERINSFNLSTFSQEGLANGVESKKVLYEKHSDCKLPLHLIQKIANKNEKDIFEVLLSFYLILLANLTGKQTIITGIPIANRRSEDKKTHGCFINNLPLIIRLEKNEPFSKVCDDASQQLHRILKYQRFDVNTHLPELFGKSLKNVGFMNNSVTFYKHEINFDLAGLDSSIVPIEHRYAMFPLSVEFEVLDKDIIIHVQSEDTIDARLITMSFQNIIKAYQANRLTSTSEYSILSHEQKENLFYLENSNYSAKKESSSALDRFEHSVAKFPNQIAINDENSTLTYLQLDENSDSMSNTLSTYNEKFVVVSLEPNVHLLEVILAIFKAGKIYVPLDKKMPESRKNLILKQISNSLIITDYNDHLFYSYNHILLQKLIEDSSQRREMISKQKEKIAYIIFTSGSTGTPKGVLVSHVALSSLLTSQRTSLPVPQKSNWVLFHSYSFDYSMFEILGSLANCGTLHIVPQETKLYPDQFRRFIKENNINILTQTPSSFLSLQQYDMTQPDQLQSLKLILIGGEDVKFSDLKPWTKKYGFSDSKIYNLYGITEAAVVSTAHLVTEKDVMNSRVNIIGHSLSQTVISVKNNFGQDVIPGFKGELIITGNQVASGYLNNPEATRTAFKSSVNSYTFKSGDLVKVLPNGEIQYLARIDKQVQISGHRVEIGEVENAFDQLRSDIHSCVIAHDFGENDRRLIGYYTAKSSIEEGIIIKYLKTKLPTYMIPAFYVFLDGFPLTVNGKVNKRKLPLPDKIMNSSSHNIKSGIIKKSSTLEQIRAIWYEVLNNDHISNDDNFFEAGGTSVLITQVYIKILEKFDLNQDEMSMIDLFDYATPAEQAKYIAKLKKG